MNINKINTQIERLEQELAKLKAEATAPSKYEIEYEDGDTFCIGIRGTLLETSGTDEDFLNAGRYRSTRKFTNEHLKTQIKMMRLGALIEAVSIELGMEDWVADWSDEHEYCVRYNHKGGEYCLDYWRTAKTVGVIYMPKEVAERVCEILNNKEYKL